MGPLRRSRQTTLAAWLFAGALFPLTAAAGLTAGDLDRQIRETDWNLKHSSVAPTIDRATQSRSAALLERARAEIAAGHLRTAQDLIRQAARPLVEMDMTEVAHPDPTRQFSDLRAALESITIGAEAVAREKGKPMTLQPASRQAIARSERLLKQGRTDDAMETLRKRYVEVKQTVATLRDGDLVVIRAPDGRDAKHWEDGLRRMDERRYLTEYLIIEARAEGIDDAPLHEALAIAQRSVKTAEDHARVQRWDQAYASLDLAYVQIEEQWKKVGLEW